MQTTLSEVVVIGAGAAGLAAARELAREDVDVVVIEARERLGGRIWTTRDGGSGQPLELGAAFVHGGNASLNRITRDARLPVTPLPERHWITRRGQPIDLGDFWARIDAVCSQIGPDFTGDFARWWRQHEAELEQLDRTLVRDFVTGFHAAPLEAMSAQTLYAATQQPPEAQMRVEGGFERVIAALHRELPERRVAIRLGDPVTSVQWNPRRVLVTTLAGARIEARAVIVTLPLGVLQALPPAAGAITFEPELEHKRTLWNRLQFGHALRINLRFGEGLWDDPLIPAALRANEGRDFGFLHAQDGAFPVWWASAPAPVLTGWTGGPHALALADRPDQEIFRFALFSLAAQLHCTEAELGEQILSWHLHNWTADPFTRGAYSFSQAGEEDAPQRLAEPAGDVIFFAGEATADVQEIGTVHGALASGERAAEDVLSVLHPPRAAKKLRPGLTASASQMQP